MKKDKFSFRIRGYVPVFGNDFSTNYTSSFRMKKDKKAKEEINSIFSRMNKSTNKSVDTNSTQNEELQRTNSYVLRELLDDDQLSVNDEISEDNDSRSLKSEKGMKELTDTNIKTSTSVSLSEEEVEILVKVRQSGTMKSIVFQSNIRQLISIFFK